MTDTLDVTLIHEIPGRIRARLSHFPADEDRFVASVASHDGVKDVRLTKISRSCVITYGEGHLTTQELLLRSAIALSVDHGDRPVQVLTRPKHEVMTDGAVLAGLLVVCAAAARWPIRAANLKLIDSFAGAAVALAVAQHGWREAREKGYIHPELLSLGYLVTSYFNDNLYRGAVITWAASFGRHLLTGEEDCIEISPVDDTTGKKKNKGYQVKIAKHASVQTPLLNFLHNVLRMVGIAGIAGGYDSLFGELQHIASAHGEVLEGMSGQTQNIPIVFK